MNKPVPKGWDIAERIFSKKSPNYLSMLESDYIGDSPTGRKLLEQLLYEAYTKPELSWIDEFAYDLYLLNQEEYNLSEKEYNQELKNIEKKYNIEIHIDYKAISELDPDIRKTVIGHYDIIHKIYFLKVSPDFFYFFEDKDSTDYIRMKKFLAIILSHENTHEQQFKEVPLEIKKKILAKYEKSRLPNGRINPKYFIQKFEVDAFARSIVEGLLNYYNKDDIIKKLKDGSFSNFESFKKIRKQDRLLFNRLQTYIDIKNRYPDIWKKFIKEVLDYLESYSEE